MSDQFHFKWPSWIGRCLVGLCLGLLVFTLTSTPPLTFAQDEQSYTAYCHDGSDDGQGGYTGSSSCARIRATYQCSHDDKPNGSTDTLTCSESFPDSDGDGFPDETDQCPTTGSDGQGRTEGCPNFPDFPFGGPDDGCDPGTGDPVSLIDGSWYWHMRCLTLGGKGLPISVNLRYNTRSWRDNHGEEHIGVGWLTSYSRHLKPLTDEAGTITSIQLYTANSIMEDYRPVEEQPSQFQGDSDNYTTLAQQSDGTYVLTRRDGTQDIFDSAGTLIKVRDRFGNETILTWNSTTNTRTIQNARTGQAIKLIHTPVNGTLKLTRIEDTTAATRTVSLTYNRAGLLAQITDADGKIHAFRYDAEGRIDAYYDPSHPPTGTPTVSITYDTEEPYRVTKQTLANGNTIDFDWTVADDWDLAVIHNAGTSDERIVRYQHLEEGFGQITRIYNPNSTAVYTRMEYDDQNQLKQLTNPEGRRTRYTYDTNTGDLLSTRVCTSSSCGSYETTMTYNNYGQLTELVQPMGEKTRLTYNDANGALITSQQVDTTGNIVYQTSYDIDATGLLLGTRLPDNTWNRQTYDAFGYPSQTIFDATHGGNTNRLNISNNAIFDTRGFLSSETNAYGTTTNYEYNNKGWLLATIVDNPNGSTTRTEYTYDNMGNVTQIVADVGGLNLTTHYEYALIGTAGNYAVTKMTDAEGNVVRYEYNRNGERISMLEEGVRNSSALFTRRTAYAYTPEGWLDTIQDHDGRILIDYEYNNVGQIISETDARGVQNEYRYTSKGLLSRESFGSADIGESPAVEAVYTYRYDGADRLIETDGPRTEVIYTYDSFGRLAVTTDATDNTTTYEYDNRNRLITTVVGSNNPSEAITTQYAYDTVSRMVAEQVDPTGLNITTRYQYDIGDSNDRWNLRRVTDPNGHSTTYDYNAFGQVSRTIDAANQQWQYQYDNLGRLIGQRDSLGIAEGAISNRDTTYTVDGLGRTTALSRNGQSERWHYNADGSLYYYDDLAGQRTIYTYDNTGRLIRTQYPSGAHSAGTVTYTYSDNNLLQRMTDQHGSTDYTYDALNRLQTRTRGGRAVTYSYFDDNWVKKIDYWGQNDVDYTYDGAGRPTDIKPWNGGSLRYDYTSTGLLKRQMRIGSINTDYTHDRAGQLTMMDTTNSDGTLHRLTYPATERDQNGNIGQMVETYGGQTFTTDYAYDVLNRLTGVTYPAIPEGPGAANVTYAYDAVGNRTMVNGDSTSTGATGWIGVAHPRTEMAHSSTTDSAIAPHALGQTNSISLNTTQSVIATMTTLWALLLFGLVLSVWQRIHERGYRVIHVMLISSLVGSSIALAAIPTSYAASGPQSYDASDRLAGATYTYDAAGNLTSDGITTYTYDTANRLIQTNTAGQISSYTYDGHGNLIGVSENGVTKALVPDESLVLPVTLGEIDTASGAMKLYAYTPNGQLAAFQENDTVIYPLVDHQGSIRHLVDRYGTLSDSVHYDAWGTVRQGENSLNLGYTGERMNADGTIFLRARHYQPALGRFLQRDTIDPGLLGRGTQGHHRYSYVENNPVMYTDPSGHASFIRQPLSLPLSTPPLSEELSPIPNIGDNFSPFPKGFNFDEDCIPINWPMRPPSPPSDNRPYDPGNPFRDPFNNGLEPGMTPEDIQNAPGGDQWDAWENPGDYPELTPTGEANIDHCAFGLCGGAGVEYHPIHGGAAELRGGFGTGGGYNFGEKPYGTPSNITRGADFSNDATVSVFDDTVGVDFENGNPYRPLPFVNAGTGDVGVTIYGDGRAEPYGITGTGASTINDTSFGPRWSIGRDLPGVQRP
ncbi:MAG: RHS repeat-associated core domain-containing protein [Chloroflexota bacterium]